MDDKELRAKLKEMFELKARCLNVLVSQFFDIDSDEMIDEKIEVLRALNEGKTIGEIPNFYDILELMPKDGSMWD